MLPVILLLVGAVAVFLQIRSVRGYFSRDTRDAQPGRAGPPPDSPELWTAPAQAVDQARLIDPVRAVDQARAMDVGSVFGNPGGRFPVTVHDIPALLRLTLPELWQGRRRGLIDGEEACTILLARRPPGTPDAEGAHRAAEDAARVLALRDDVARLDRLLRDSTSGAADDPVLDQPWIFVVLNRLSVSWESFARPREVLAAAIREFEWLDDELMSWLPMADGQADDEVTTAMWRSRLDAYVTARAADYATRDGSRPRDSGH